VDRVREHRGMVARAIGKEMRLAHYGSRNMPYTARWSPDMLLLHAPAPHPLFRAILRKKIPI